MNKREFVEQASIACMAALVGTRPDDVDALKVATRDAVTLALLLWSELEGGVPRHMPTPPRADPGRRPPPGPVPPPSPPAKHGY